MRVLFWFSAWLLSLGTLEINVRYSDGLEITFHSWLNRLLKTKREARASRAEEKVSGATSAAKGGDAT